MSFLIRHCGFAWHAHGERWVIALGSPEHQDMLDLPETLK
jgi:hypothetical protein